MKVELLAWVAFGLAALPCALFLLNLFVYRRPHAPARLGAGAEGTCDNRPMVQPGVPGIKQLSHSEGTVEPVVTPVCPPLHQTEPSITPQTGPTPGPAVSVLIPARNEEQHIRGTVESVLTNRGVEFEVIVLDDHSNDRTRAIVSELAARDSRVRLERAPSLPSGWCGKQHACHVLAGLARHNLLVFMDADVHLQPEALVRMCTFMEAHPAVALASGVPRQLLGTFAERLLIPLIHFVLLGFLPMHLMRWSRWRAWGAGCGQLFIARANAYRQVGGHASIRTSLHDGLQLPRAFRLAGFRTDLFDATRLALCRMYQTAAEVWHGLGKNATEGLAAPGTIGPMTLLLLGGQVLPLLLLLCAPWLESNTVMVALSAVALSYLPRLIAVGHFQQPLISALLHPAGILALLSIQWLALWRALNHKPAHWKGRTYEGWNAKPSLESPNARS